MSALGVRHVVISPGQRSTPLVEAVLEHGGFECHTHFDERGAAALALGLSRHGDLAMVLATSGTAIANWYPSVIEARMTMAPVVFLASDRPSELLHVQANQAIDQRRLFAGYPTLELHLTAPKDAAEARLNLDRSKRALEGWRGGPIFLNIGLREPFAPPLPRDAWNAPEFEALDAWRPAPRDLPRHLDGTKRTAFVLGMRTEPRWVGGILAFAKAAGLPIVCETFQSGWFPESLRPRQVDWSSVEQVLQLGGPLVDPAVNRFLDDHAHRIVLDPFDQGRMVGNVLQLLPVNPPVDLPFWSRSTPRIPGCESSPMEHGPTDGPLHEIAKILQSGKGLGFVGNSLAIRTLNALSSSNRKWLAQRGASGIDGNVAHAVGIARSHPNHAMVAWLGDVTTAHDLNGLTLLRDTPNLQVVVVVDQGGQIFAHLSRHAEANPERLARYWLQDPAIGFEQVAQAMGLRSCTVDPRGLEAALASDAQVIAVQVGAGS